MGTRTADFGRLVSAFHLEILEGSVRKFGTGLYLPTSVRKDEEAAAIHRLECPEQSGKPEIIANFLNSGNALRQFYRVLAEICGL